MAGLRPSIESTSGRSIWSRNWRADGEKGWAPTARPPEKYKAKGPDHFSGAPTPLADARQVAPDRKRRRRHSGDVPAWKNAGLDAVLAEDPGIHHSKDGINLRPGEVVE